MVVTPVPVLLYHAVMADPPAWIAEFTVGPRQFAAQLDAVVASGRTPVTAGAFAAALTGQGQLPARPAVLTFDDGFADLPGPTAEALAARSLPATAYLTTGALARGRGIPGHGSLLPPAPMMSLSQAASLEGHGVEIGAHTVTHAQLDTLPASALRGELRDSKDVLEDTLGHAVDHLAYPHGYNSRAVRDAARAAGYTSAAAVRHALSSTADEPFRMARLILRRSHTAADVAAWMAGEGARAAPFPDAARTVGWRIYRRARARFLGPKFAG
ncbi:polysaccharide deacetylase family protein [Streptomyces tremellae]|uniref:NodB homology domain-containing protein n=1 Tax=Streptomyces tremellae TaxID=1124239 RepID=A0ABP7ERV2_9ACTN